MRKDWLFPHRFRLLGWILFIPTLLLGVILVNVTSAEIMIEQLVGNYWDEGIAILLIISLLMIGFAREKIEDEMIQQVRLESLQWAIYVHYGCLLLAIIWFYDLAFLRVMIYTMFTPLLVFVSRYLWLLYRLRRSSDSSSLSGLVSL